MKLADHFIGQLKSGQADVESWHESKFARVEYDGSTWFYDLPSDTTLEDFKIAAEVAFEMDADYAEIWGSDGFARVAF